MAVTAFVMLRNPLNFYRRMFASILGSGFLVHAAGFGLRGAVHVDPQKWGWIQWDGTVDSWFYVAWVAALIALTVGDIVTGRDHHRHG